MAFPDGWTKRATITVDPSLFGSNLSDFSLLLTAAVLPDLSAAQSDGGDIRFSTDSAGATRLACEVVSFGTAGADAEIYVKLPSGSSTVDTVIYIWWAGGGSEVQPAVTDTYGRNAVWSSFSAVYHCNDTSTQLTDSTGVNDAADHSSPTYGATGLIGDGATIDAATDAWVASMNSSLDFRTEYHWTGFIKGSTSGQSSYGGVLGSEGTSTNYISIQRLSSFNDLAVYNAGSRKDFTGVWASLLTSAWHMLSVRWDGSNVYVGVDSGSETSQAQTTAPGYNASSQFNVVSARIISGVALSTIGDYDELRFAKQDLGNDWRVATYRSLTAPATYITAGSVEDVGGGGISEEVGLATETDSAFGTAAAKRLAVGLAAGSEAALAVTARRVVTVGLSAEADAGLGATAAKAMAAGLAASTEAALAATARRTHVAGLAAEADAALAVATAKAMAAGLAGETDTGLPVVTARVVPVGLAAESDAAPAVAAIKALAAGLAAEADAAFATASAKAMAAGLAGEADSAAGATARRVYGLGLAAEAAAALAVAAAKLRAVGLAIETDSAFGLAGGAGVELTPGQILTPAGVRLVVSVEGSDMVKVARVVLGPLLEAKVRRP